MEEIEEAMEGTEVETEVAIEVETEVETEEIEAVVEDIGAIEEEAMEEIEGAIWVVIEVGDMGATGETSQAVAVEDLGEDLDEDVKGTCHT